MTAGPGSEDDAASVTAPLRVARARRRRRWILSLLAAGLVLVLGIVTAVVVASGPQRDVAGGGGSAASDGLGSSLPITVDGTSIRRGDQPWWFLGFNSFVWSDNCGFDEERMSVEDVEEWFASMRHDGHGAVRLFFYEGWNIERLDAAVESAKRHGIYLMITLDDAIGGCGENDKDESWFADQAERDVFRDHMTSLLERYRGEPTIAWFEYFNEPSPSTEGLREFYDEMGEIADEIDPDRLFASGTIAPYDEPEAYRELHESPGVDIASLHEYDENEIESNHGPDARAEAAGKPVIVGEFGINASQSGDDCDFDFVDRAERFAEKVEVYTSIEGYVGALAWAWQPGNDDECQYGNLDADLPSQDVLRNHVP